MRAGPLSRRRTESPFPGRSVTIFRSCGEQLLCGCVHGGVLAREEEDEDDDRFGHLVPRRSHVMHVGETRAGVRRDGSRHPSGLRPRPRSSSERPQE